MLDYIWSIGDEALRDGQKSTTKAGMSFRISNLTFLLVSRHHHD